MDAWLPNWRDMFIPTVPLLEIFLRGTVEPDADGDGFGDETQDRCPGSSGATAGCVPKKKCKRKKRKGKKKSAAAKKKRCKRKGKKRK